MALVAQWVSSNPQQIPTANALKWGNGIDPIHAEYGDGTGRGTATNPGQLTVDPSLTAIASTDSDYGYQDEDSADALYGYGYQTGTADRSSWADPANEAMVRAATTDDYPSWKQSGKAIRAINKGASVTNSIKLGPDEDAAQGWENKVTSYVEDAGISDPSQYIMQTSMVQRDKVRAGTQTPGGRASEYVAPIASRIPGMKLKVWTDLNSPRHRQMEPREQRQMIRPFSYRTAGTGFSDNMGPNSMYVSEPLSRTPPPDPYAGQETPDDLGDGAGFTSEDMNLW